MSTKARRHIHKYYRAELPYGRVWACALPGCTHYMPQYMDSMVNGKYSICWTCGEQMILHPQNMNMVQPVCDTCRLGVDLVDNIRQLVPEK